MIRKLKQFRETLLRKNVMYILRTPFDMSTEWHQRSKRSFGRFFIRFLYEEVTILTGVFRAWLNRQLLLSHNVRVGADFRIGPMKCTFFIPEGGRVIMGDDVRINSPIELVTTTSNYSDVEIRIGNGTHIGSNAAIRAMKSISIGENCLIAPSVIISDANAHPLDPEKRRNREKIPDQEIRPIVIGNNVWIGERATIAPGVKIGDGTIVGANAVVIKDLPENIVAKGNPARVSSWLKKSPSDGGNDQN